MLCSAIVLPRISCWIARGHDFRHSQRPLWRIVAGARIEISGGNLSQPLVLVSDASGKFTAPNLAPGKYSVHVVKEGFETLITLIDLQGRVDLPLQLTITTQQTQITVTDKSLAFGNSDPVYHQLRDIGLGESYRLRRCLTEH